MEGLSKTDAVEIEAIKINGLNMQRVNEKVVVEQALTVYLNDEEFVTVVCSPGQEKELVTGLLCSEGIINKPEQLTKLSIDHKEGLAWAETSVKNNLGEAMYLKRYLTSCCGKGRSSFYYANDARLVQKNESPMQITSHEVSRYMKLLDEKSELFHQTGGVHGAVLASAGHLEHFAFDIGRHNVLDKLYGYAFTRKMDLSQKVIAFSGRMSSEIVIKAGKMGCPILMGVSAPSALALTLANELGITVIGFARQNSMNIYTHPERILILEKGVE